MEWFVMRHRKKSLKLGRSPSHRRALFASLVCNLIERGRITTTIAKAKYAKTLAEKMITMGKKGTLAARRSAISELMQKKHVVKLFSEIAPRFNDRHGGYTRIIKKGRRISDSSEMAVLEWVDSVAPVVKVKKTDKKTEKAKAS